MGQKLPQALMVMESQAENCYDPVPIHYPSPLTGLRAWSLA